MSKILEFVSEKEENIFGKGENAGYQHLKCSPFSTMFPEAFLLRGHSKLVLCGERLTLYLICQF